MNLIDNFINESTISNTDLVLPLANNLDFEGSICENGNLILVLKKKVSDYYSLYSNIIITFYVKNKFFKSYYTTCLRNESDDVIDYNKLVNKQLVHIQKNNNQTIFSLKDSYFHILFKNDIKYKLYAYLNKYTCNIYSIKTTIDNPIFKYNSIKLN